MEEEEECVPVRPFERSERRRDGAGAVEAAVVIGAASEVEPVTGAAAAAETMVVASTGAARALASAVEAVGWTSKVGYRFLESVSLEKTGPQ